jgi:hypothetical protein
MERKIISAGLKFFFFFLFYVFADGTPRIAGGQVSGKADDYWNLYQADAKLMKEIGVQSHRLSIEWSRIEVSFFFLFSFLMAENKPSLFQITTQKSPKMGNSIKQQLNIIDKFCSH